MVTLQETTKLCSKIFIPFHTITMCDTSGPTSLLNLGNISLFHFKHLNGCAVVSYFGLKLHFYGDYDGEYLLVFIDHWLFLLWSICSNLLLILKSRLFLSYEFFLYSGYNIMLRYVLQIFSFNFSLDILFFNDIFSVAKVFIFWWSIIYQLFF